MRQVFRIDGNGFYKEPVILMDNEKTPVDCVEDKPTDGLYKAQRVEGQWIEGATQEEIEATQLPQAPPVQERIEALEEALLLLMME